MRMLPGASLDPARRLMFSPPWDELGVVFDARSGDFWVVDSKVRDVLQSANTEPTLAAERLNQLSPEVIENLVSHGIIRVFGTS